MGFTELYSAGEDTIKDIKPKKSLLSNWTGFFTGANQRREMEKRSAELLRSAQQMSYDTGKLIENTHEQIIESEKLYQKRNEEMRLEDEERACNVANQKVRCS
jgi:hypothetical protein